MARGQKKEMGAGGLRGPLRCGPLGLRAACTAQILPYLLFPLSPRFEDACPARDVTLHWRRVPDTGGIDGLCLPKPNRGSQGSYVQ
jgi:hypothetical protein